MEFEFHPLANLLPLVEGEDFSDLVADIRSHGLHERITIWQGQILDGRNRYRAAREAGLEIEKRHLEFFRPELHGDPIAFVVSKNIHRRHLDASQRAMAAARLATLRQGARTDLSPNGEMSQGQAAEAFNVGKRNVERASDVIARAAPELVAAVDKGLVAVSAAADALSLPHERQRRIAEDVAAGKRNAVRTALKQVQRAQRENDLATRQRELPNKKFGVILADPEWKFEVYSRETGMDRAPENHYPTSELEEIKARDVDSISADDCVLFLWATVPMLPQALDVMAAWGFTYKSHVAWDKRVQAMGYWFRNAHELLLVGTRGNVPAPAPGTQLLSLISSLPGEHSEKPDWQYELIESYFPNLPKIELNARRARPGWDAWGYEAPEVNPAANGSESEGMQPAEESAGADAGMKPLPSRLADGRTSVSSSSEIDGQAEAASAVSATPFDPVTGEIIEDDTLEIPSFLRRAQSEANA